MRGISLRLRYVGLVAVVGALTLAGAATGARAQSPAPSGGAPQLIRSEAHESESNSAIFDALRVEAQSSGATVFIVSHLGAGERAPALNIRRLHNARARWAAGLPDASKMVQVAVGERVSGPGTVDVYLGGVRRWTVEFKRGEDLAVDCCGKLPAYYPWYRGRPTVQL